MFNHVGRRETDVEIRGLTQKGSVDDSGHLIVNIEKKVLKIMFPINIGYYRTAL